MLEFGGGLGVAVADLHVLSLLLISCYGWFSWVGVMMFRRNLVVGFVVCMISVRVVYVLVCCWLYG